MIKIYVDISTFLILADKLKPGIYILKFEPDDILIIPSFLCFLIRLDQIVITVVTNIL